MKRWKDWVADFLDSIAFPVFQNGPLLAIIHFRIPLMPACKGSKRLKKDRTPHADRPDGDNLEKFLGDALTQVIWGDDRQLSIVLRIKEKTKDKIGETNLYVTEYPNEPINYRLIAKIIGTELEEMQRNVDIEAA